MKPEILWIFISSSAAGLSHIEKDKNIQTICDAWAQQSNDI